MNETPKAMSPKAWREKIGASIKRRDTLLTDWRDNVNYRVQKPFTSVGVDTVAVPEDWARTKQKTAQLMFQVPKVLLTPKQPRHSAAAPIFQAVLNHKLHHEIKAEVMLDECLADVVNAAGLAVSLVSYHAVTEKVEVPEFDISQLPPDQQAAALQNGEIPMIEVDNPIYEAYRWDRISPGAFLWPAEFTGSNWDDAPWLGYESWMLLEEARKAFPTLPVDFKATGAKPKLLAEDADDEAAHTASDDYVKVQTIWYKASLYDADALHPEHLRRVVFVEGHDKPVVQEDCTWQKWVEPYTTESKTDDKGQVIEEAVEVPGHFVGIRKFPLRVVTLTYVSDLATPPSDSQAGRAPVRELIRSRSQMIRQRDRSIPMRWFDTNRLDPEIGEKIKSGEWQDAIPINGPGDRAIGEVARAQYPRENFTFQNVIGSDLDRAWSLSNNQLASQGAAERSATEINVMQSAANIRLEYEKTRVARFIVGGVEVLAGLVQMFTDRTDYIELVGTDGEKRLASWDKDRVQGEFVFDFVPDSGDRVDPAVRQERILKLYNLAANDPTINREHLTRELVQSYGMDPTLVMKPPPEPKPEVPNISYRFGGEDMLNPMAVALLLKANPDLGENEIKAAAMMIRDAIMHVQAPPAPPPAPAPGPPPPAGPPPDVEPPTPTEPILKRLGDGSRMM